MRERFELLKAVKDISVIARFKKKSMKKRCSVQWYKKIQYFTLEQLKKEFRILLGGCGLKGIARYYDNKLKKQNTRIVILLIVQFLEQLGLQDALVVQDIINHCKIGELFFNIFSFLTFIKHKLIMFIVENKKCPDYNNSEEESTMIPTRILLQGTESPLPRSQLKDQFESSVVEIASSPRVNWREVKLPNASK